MQPWLLSSLVLLAPMMVVAFERPPLLEDAETTRNTVQSRSATYYFTLDGRGQTGASLQELVIQQLPSPDRIQFVITETAVALETNQLLPIDVSLLPEGDRPGVRIVLRQPLAGPYRLRVSLRPVQNPRTSGVYLFDVQARAENERQLRTLGIARIHFYDGFSRWGH